MDHDICEVNRDACELSFEELEQVSGGDVLNKVIDATEKGSREGSRRFCRLVVRLTEKVAGIE